MRKSVTAVVEKSKAHEFDFRSKPQPNFGDCVLDVTGVAMDVLGLPFDVARAQYARAVQVGLIERSMLASRNFSRALSSLEQLALGPWARHV